MKSLFWKFFAVLLAAFLIDVTIVGLTLELIHQGSLPLLTDLVPSGCKDFIRNRPSPALPIMAGTVTSLFFGALLALYFAKPIRLLSHAFTELGKGNLAISIGPSMAGRHDEFANLGRDFDKMAAQIGKLMNAQQRLLHDVSHELRSPLARIQAAIGLAEQQPETMQDNLSRIDQQSQRMNHLIDELLTLSRLEAGMPVIQFEDIDVVCLLDEIVENARFEANPKQVDIVYPGMEKVLLAGYGELLYRAVENVLRNAIQQSKAGDKVTIIVKVDHQLKRLNIIISDQGAGIEEQFLKEIFQPFFRVRHANKVNGIGLGLTIAQQAVSAHNGQIIARNRIEGGFQVEIKIPIVGNYLSQMRLLCI